LIPGFLFVHKKSPFFLESFFSKIKNEQNNNKTTKQKFGGIENE